MQSVIKSARSSPVFWGVAGLVLVTVIGLVVAWVYVSPPKQQTVTFYTDDAASVHPGDTVRIAGIIVGKVKDLSIESESNPHTSECGPRRVCGGPVSSRSSDADRGRRLLRDDNLTRRRPSWLPRNSVGTGYDALQPDTHAGGLDKDH